MNNDFASERRAALALADQLDGCCARRPAAFKPPRDAPAPVPFPAGERIKEPSQATRDRWARQSRALDAARHEAHAQGFQEGYMRGARMGMWCGALGGALVVGLAFLAAPVLQAWLS